MPQQSPTDRDVDSRGPDPAGFFEFDLAGGEVRARSGNRVLVLSDTVVAPLVSAAVHNGDLTAVRRLGRHMGEEVASAIGSDAGDSTPELVLGHAATIVSLFGWGRLHLERWGDALCARLEKLPQLDADHLAIAALLGGLFSALAKQEVACVPVSTDGRFLLVDPQIAEQVWNWSRGGDDVPAIVGRLQSSAEAAR
ncbi:MAG: hypothetical protein M3Y87_03890 [Myxococcota bacterium]|nr:hypothetical protein [Myxococcota bacterium]